MHRSFGAVFFVFAAFSGPISQATPVRSVDLPIEHVTVFGDRAQVTRSGQVTVPTLGEVGLPLLPMSADPASVRVDGRGVSVSRVTVRRVERSALPQSEATTLLKDIARAERDLKAVEAKLAAIEDERRFVQSIQPKASPIEGAVPTVFSFQPTGWVAAFGFLDGRTKTLVDATQPVQTQRLQRIAELAALRARAQQLLAVSTAMPGYEVVVEVKGSGRLELVYVAANAHWFPSYDVRFDPEKQQVSLALGALVSQQTGEDWNDAKLTLSTAIPATVASVPQLSVWKIGDRERFIPTPQALPQPRPSEPGPWLPQLAVSSDDSGELRRALELAVAPNVRPSPPPRPAPSMAMREQSYEAEERMAVSESMVRGRSAKAQTRMSVGADSADSSEMSESVSFSSPGAWRPPALPPNSPAALAGGYAFRYDAARRETVSSGTRDALVGLSTVSLPAEPRVRILPALSAEAFLVAEMTNTTPRPLFEGQAALFVGGDLVGRAQVPTTARGAKLALPLGIDDAIRVERHVSVVQSEKGVFSKDDVTVYDVEIELLNPRANAVQAVVVDQIPIQKGEKVKITLESTSPALSSQPDADGLFEWHVQLNQGRKTVLKYRYSVVRPKDWKLWQQSQPKGGR